MKKGLTLCLPDGEKSCFACCPPIRPAGYEHIQHQGAIKRLLRDNTQAYRLEERRVRPITGFSCWALGYLDPGFRLVGCLLHPARNKGKDLRFRVDYGEKCRRETCPEAGVFDRLQEKTQAFWIHLADGLDSFSYSSRDKNPLFHFLNWGPEILDLIAAEAPATFRSVDSLLEAFPFFVTRLSPRGWSYPVTRLAVMQGAGLYRQPGRTAYLERGLCDLLERMNPQEVSIHTQEAPLTHRLPMDRSFLDFLRLAAGIRRINLKEARALKCRVDQELQRIGGSMG